MARDALNHPLGSCLALAISPDEKWLAIAGSNAESPGTATASSIQLYTIAALERPPLVIELPNEASDIEFTRDATQLIIALPGESLIWTVPADGDLVAAEPVATVDGFGYLVAASPQNDRYVVNGKANGLTPALFTLSHNEPNRELGNFASMTGISDTEMSPDGTALAVACGNGQICLVDLASGEPSRILRGHRHRAKDAAFLGDGSKLVSVGDDQTVRLWRVGSLDADKLTLPLVPEKAGGWAVEFLADHRSLAAAYGEVVRVWDVYNRELLAERQFPQRIVRSLTSSPINNDLALVLVGQSSPLQDTTNDH